MKENGRESRNVSKPKQQQARREEEQRATRAQEQSRQRQDAWTSAINLLETLVEIKERRQQE